MFRRFSRDRARKITVLAAVVVAVPLGLGAPAAAAQNTVLAPLSASLSGLLGTVADTVPMTVLVHGTDVTAADAAARAAGLTTLSSFNRIGVVAEIGRASGRERGEISVVGG